MKILSVCSVYPNPNEPGYGVFSRACLQALAETDEIRVVAPIAPFDYDNPKRRGLGRRSVPAYRRDGKVDVFHPAWVYFPRNVALNGICLALSLALPVWRMRKRFHFDLIDAHFGHPEGVGAWLLAKLMGCPYVIRLNGNELVNRKYGLRSMLMSRAFRGAARIIAVSNDLRSLAVELGAEPEKTKVIWYGVDLQIHRPQDRDRVRRLLGINEGRPVIFSAGRLVHVKAHDNAIRALRLLRDRGVTADLVIAGEPGRGLPSSENALRRLTASLGLTDSVRFLGWIPPEKIADWMSAADVFCFPSRRASEGCPNVVMEALACGCPVVATDVGTVRELISSDDCGFVVPPDDSTSLAEALDRALKKNWYRKAIARWGQGRSWGQSAQEVRKELLESCRTQEVCRVAYEFRS